MIAHSRRNVWLLLFLCNSLVMQMLLGQADVVVPFSLVYFLLVLPALLIPLKFLPEIAAVLGDPRAFCYTSSSLRADFTCFGVTFAR
jgi:hypothetical protein